MVARVVSFALRGVDAYPVLVEVDVQNGLPSFDVVGLPDPAVREARERVRSAIRNVGCEFPLRRITVNLAPADLRKAGPGFDLPLALAVLAATGQLGEKGSGVLPGLGVTGELSLDGQVRPVPGALAAAEAARACGLRALLVPAPDAAEAALAGGPPVFPAPDLGAVLRWLRHGGPDAPPGAEAVLRPVTAAGPCPDDPAAVDDLGDVQGQEAGKRALEIAAAGGHNLLLVGPPGAGKSMLARRLPGILPPLSREEALEVTRIYSAAGLVPAPARLMTRPPYRAPHHSASRAALVGSLHRPGELTLAHRGVLFLDELPEFPRDALEALRQPLEEGRITIARTGGSVTYPADVMLVAAANPSPCGQFPGAGCTCAPAQVERYLSRLSGPLVDRFDLQVRVARVSYRELTGAGGRSPARQSERVRARVEEARERQRRRLAGHGCTCNARMPPRLLRHLCRLPPEAEQLLARAFDSLGLTLRGHDRVLRVARTIADLEGSRDIRTQHLAEALQYRFPLPAEAAGARP